MLIHTYRQGGQEGRDINDNTCPKAMPYNLLLQLQESNYDVILQLHHIYNLTGKS